MNRYFIVSYMLNERTYTTYGHTVCNTYEGNYINLEALAKRLNEESKNIIITNIIELNEKDYEHFLYKEKENEK